MTHQRKKSRERARVATACVIPPRTPSVPTPLPFAIAFFLPLSPSTLLQLTVYLFYFLNHGTIIPVF